MFNDDIDIVCESSYKKVKMQQNNFLGYFIASVLAGVYAAFGVLFTYSVGAYLHNDFSAYKLIMGVCFSCALSFVYFGGSELFTGNTFVMSIGAFKRKITWSDAIKVCFFCYLGNIVGSIFISLLALMSGLLNDDVGRFIAEYSSIKMSLKPVELLARAIMCNMLVSLATWCWYKMKSESGKIILIFWCIVAFFTTGFEHSIANMTLLILGTINPYETSNSFYGLFYNISLVTIGNIIGAVLFLAVPYLIISKEKIQNK